MTNKIETFKRIKEHMVIVGCLPFKNVPRWCQSIPVDLIYVAFIYISLTLFVWTTAWFFIFKRRTFDETAESVFFTGQALLYFVMYPLLYRTKESLLDTFEELDNIIEISKYLNHFVDDNDLQNDAFFVFFSMNLRDAKPIG